METLVNNYINRYYEEYDDHDRYFDYVYDFYETLNTYINNNMYYILDQNNFTDFFDLCVNNINRPWVDNSIQSKEIGQLRREIGRPLVDFIPKTREGPDVESSVEETLDELYQQHKS